MEKRKRGVKSKAAGKAVIFDFDGTIADSFEYVVAFLQTEARDQTIFSSEQKAGLRKMSMKRLALRLGVPVWRLPLLYFRGRRVMREHMEDVRPFPGMEAVIKKLHADGYRLFIVSSNSTKNIRHFLRRHELAGYFTAVRGGAGVAGKSSLIQQLRLRHRLHKGATWYVGDETADVVAAARAGIRCLAVGWGFADPDKLRQLGPEAFAQRVEDVPNILMEGEWKK
jgi:phosphoglycolate phosphatase-like HAD superfamily hydrolase